MSVVWMGVDRREYGRLACSWKVGDDNDVTDDDDVDDNDADAAAYALVSGGGIVTLGDDTREAGMAETRAQHPSLKTK